MKPLPFLDSSSAAILSALFLALLWLQWRFALRRQYFAALSGIAGNCQPAISRKERRSAQSLAD